MATHLTAHRDERRLLGINFEPDLQAPLTSVDYVTILDPDGLDVTDEFRGDPPEDPTLDSTGYIVSFWKEPESASALQLPGIYRVKCKGTSTDGEEPIALGEGDRLILLKIVGD